MVLTERIEEDGKVVLVFTGNDKGKTVERCLAEAICALAEKNGSVSSWAIHFSSLHHPFSTTQRLREMSAKFGKFWREDMASRYDLQSAPTGLIFSDDDFAYRFEKSEFKYYFSPHFVAWLRREYLEKEPDHVPAD